ncbi:hypothetical protein ABOONEI_132 [Aciduliprofundum boonei T469]|nr:hypothetical protein ABOONEI_132 [Aciduliprofundum boonei T469]
MNLLERTKGGISIPVHPMITCKDREKVAETIILHAKRL